MTALSDRIDAINAFKNCWILAPLTREETYIIINNMHDRMVHRISQLFIGLYPNQDEKTHQFKIPRKVRTAIQFTFDPLINAEIKSLLSYSDTSESREEILLRVERTFSGIYLAYKNALDLKNSYEVELVQSEAGTYVAELTAPLDEDELLNNSIFIPTFSSESTDESISQKEKIQYQILSASEKIIPVDKEIQKLSEQKKLFKDSLKLLESQIALLKQEKNKLSSSLQSKLKKLTQKRAKLLSDLNQLEKKIAPLESEKKRLDIFIKLSSKKPNFS